MPKKILSNKNIMTGVVCGLALILVLIVVLVETGVFEREETTTEVETIMESTVIVVTGTNEFGEEFQYTMLDYYPRPNVSSNHRYPTTKGSTTETTTEVRYIEQTSIVHLTDPNGIPLFNDDGTPVTEIVTYTIAENSLTQTTQQPPKTSVVAVTDESGNQQTDVSGNPITEVVTYTETTTQGPDIWSQNTVEGTTGKFDINIETEVSRDDALAQAIVDQINLDREAAGLPKLEHVTGLKASARVNSTAMALPEIYGEDTVDGAYTLVTPYGGNPVYQTVAAANREKLASAETTQIGVGVVKYKDKYYTTVIFG